MGCRDGSRGGRGGRGLTAPRAANGIDEHAAARAASSGDDARCTVTLLAQPRTCVTCTHAKASSVSAQRVPAQP